MSPVTNQWIVMQNPHSLLIVSVENGQTHLSDPHASSNNRLLCMSALVQESLLYTPHVSPTTSRHSLTNFWELGREG